MPEVERVNYEALDSYSSYSLAWLGPIVYPLSLALIAQSLIYADLLGSRTQTLERFRSLFQRLLSPLVPGQVKGQPAPNCCVDVVVICILVAETIFVLTCILQCIINFSNRSFVGGSEACDFQAWYATYYSFSSMGLAAYGFASTCYILTSSAPSCALLGAVGGLIHCIAVVCASLPLAGVGGYLFPRDYCMFNVEGDFFAILSLIWYTGCIGIMIGSTVVVSKGKNGKARSHIVILLAAIALYFVAFAWSVSIAIVIAWLANGTVYSSSAWRLYGAQAIILHSNQLFVPFLFGGLWRYQLLGIISPSSPSAIDTVSDTATQENISKVDSDGALRQTATQENISKLNSDGEDGATKEVIIGAVVAGA